MRARRETKEGFDRARAASEPQPSAAPLVEIAEIAQIAETAPVELVTADAGATEARLGSDAGDSNGMNATSFVSATHAALFVADEAVRCDVCNAIVAEDADEGYAVTGRGLYVWARGEDVRYEEPHLCAGCAAAVGVSALARWEIEEEEG